jgi:hypothetical protein
VDSYQIANAYPYGHAVTHKHNDTHSRRDRYQDGDSLTFQHKYAGGEPYTNCDSDH